MKTRGIRHLMSGMVLALGGMGMSVPALADYWFYVPDASQLTYTVNPDAHVYLRNLNQFDGTVLGCCYNYWLDLTTDAGRGAWATLLAKMESQQGIWIFVGSQTAPGSVYVGNL